jgi:hypothetical protein
MPVMLSPEELAKWAEERALQQGNFKLPEEKLMLMFDFLKKIHYHILSIEIQDACKKRAGFPGIERN